VLEPVTRLAELLTIAALLAGACVVVADLGRPGHGLVNLPELARPSSPFFGTFTLVVAGDLFSSMVAFVLTLLSTVTFDGFTATPAWETLYNTFAPALRGPGGWPGIGTVGLLAFPLLFVGVYGLFATAMAGRAGHLDGVEVLRARLLAGPDRDRYHLAHSPYL
jgi:hypothetical protein